MAEEWALTPEGRARLSYWYKINALYAVSTVARVAIFEPALFRYLGNNNLKALKSEQEFSNFKGEVGKFHSESEINRLYELHINGANVSGAGNWVTLEGKLISKLSSTIDATTLNKMISQMKNAGEDGMKLALRIEKGFLENVEGYTSLIKNASVDHHSIKSVNQALDKADDLVASGKNKYLLRFEDNPSGYDIDLGIKLSSNSSRYIEVYQFKTNTAPLSKSSIQSASSQLYNAPANKRIVEFKLFDGDKINSIKNNELLKTEFKFQLFDKGLKPTNNVIIDEFHLISNGEKIKVVYQNGNLQFINF